MRIEKIFIIAIVFISGYTSVKADTIPFWSIKYNQKILKELNANSEIPEIIINKGKILARDTITISYLKDVICRDCITSLKIKDKQGKTVRVINGKGTLQPFSFKVTDLQVLGMKNLSDYFDLYYSEDKRYEIYLIRIRIR
ncbi:MAG TPA: hypothetical protein VNW99_01360 [Cytophagaceae bacterium]|nr:hypothetical protein [Cytophagaceae bacterium]